VPPLSPDQVAAWTEYAEAPWGRLRLELIRAVLERHVELPPPRLLDVGCGLGELAVAFARAGSEVTAGDASGPMVAAARDRAGETQLRWLEGDLDATVAAVADERFDLILCHNVLGYVADPAAATAALGSLLGPGGVLSLTLGNREAEPLRLAFLLRDLPAATAAAERSDPTRVGPTLGEEFRLDTLDEATAWLRDAGLEPVAAAGLLLVNHYLGAGDATNATADGYDAIRALELALCEREPYVRVAPFLHVLARRRPQRRQSFA
jgi:S-adenosylmethionine-dependent methyltransferase